MPPEPRVAGAGERCTLDVDGRAIETTRGRNLGAALANAGLLVMRRSPTGAARGLVCAMGSCFECRVEVDGRPGQRACQITCEPGMRVRLGELGEIGELGELGGFDGRAPQAASPSEVGTTLGSAGPRRDWRAADVVVVGAGPAGLAAAVSAAEAGARVLVLDEAPAPGGQLWRANHDGREAPARQREWLTRAAALGPRLRLAPRAAVVDARPDPRGGASLRVHDLDRPGTPLVELWAAKLVLATGARERLLPFPGWTLPGVVGVGGLQALAKGGLELRGAEVVVAGTGPLLLAVAADLVERGAELRAIVEQAPRRALARLGLASFADARKRSQAVELARVLAKVPRAYSSWPVRAQGRERVESVVITDARGRERELPCAWLACGFGLVPDLRLARRLGCELGAVGVAVDNDLATSIPGIYAAGETCGIAGLEAALAEGALAGRRAAGASPSPPALVDAQASARRFASRLDQAFALRPELLDLAQPETIVCRCEDVSLAALRSFGDARTAKLQTRCGMGPCQGRVCEPALEALLGWLPTQPRPPLSPVPLSSLLPPTRSTAPQATEPQGDPHAI